MGGRWWYPFDGDDRLSDDLQRVLYAIKPQMLWHGRGGGRLDCETAGQYIARLVDVGREKLSPYWDLIDRTARRLCIEGRMDAQAIVKLIAAYRPAQASYRPKLGDVGLIRLAAREWRSRRR